MWRGKDLGILLFLPKEADIQKREGQGRSAFSGHHGSEHLNENHLLMGMKHKYVSVWKEEI